jgi:hypothetical protein
MSEESSTKLRDVLRTFKLERLFFGFGAVLILLGVSTSLNLPWITQIVPDVHFRWVCVVIGSISLALAILMYYRPPTAENVGAPRSRQIPKSDASGFKEMLQDKYTSRTQRDILAVVFKEAAGGDRSLGYNEICEAIQRKIKQLEQTSPKNEIYYRLEQLFLLGFLEKIKVSDQNFYRLSSEYIKYIRSQ